MTEQEKLVLFEQTKNAYFHTAKEDVIRDCMEKFESLGDFKNSADLAAKCRRYFDFAVGNIVTFGKLEGKDLKWKVYEANGNLRLLIAVEAVTHRAYNVEHENTLWSDADLRKWLNFKFPNEAFTLQERMMLFATERENVPNREWNSQNGKPTRDKVFVLSHEECDIYMPTKEDRALGEWWWLRNKGHSLLTAESVYLDGSIYTLGLRISDPEIAVRPAMYIKLPK